MSISWRDWGDAALLEAARRQAPILLSVGYATCHWCHQMDRESFSDPGIADRLNRDFVCVKVHREERPDIDATALEALQKLTGRGGWPITLFMTPEGRSFFGGTYFPLRDGGGLPGFAKVLDAVLEAWNDRRDHVLAKAARIAGSLLVAETAGSRPSPEDALAGLAEAFDHEQGGFGGPAKFPHAPGLEFLLRCHRRGLAGAWEMAEQTLRVVARARIHDPGDGGFHRYATDREWMQPHMEKTLTDNAQLASVYLHAWQVSRDPLLREIAIGTIGYLLARLRAPGGAFWAGQDADSAAVDARVITGWNGLAITALAEAGFVEAAAKAADFVLSEVRLPDGRLARSWREAGCSGPAFADDHAFLGRGLLAVHAGTLESRWARAGVEQAELLLAEHVTPDGGIRAAPRGATGLVDRPATCHDGELPSAPAAVADLLARAWLLTEDERYRAACERIVTRHAPDAAAAPERAASLVAAIDLLDRPGPLIAIAATRPSADALLTVLRERYLPDAVVTTRPVEDPPAAYVCENFACRLPARSPEELARQLDALSVEMEVTHDR